MIRDARKILAHLLHISVLGELIVKDSMQPFPAGYVPSRVCSLPVCCYAMWLEPCCISHGLQAWIVFESNWDCLASAFVSLAHVLILLNGVQRDTRNTVQSASGMKTIAEEHITM